MKRARSMREPGPAATPPEYWNWWLIKRYPPAGKGTNEQERSLQGERSGPALRSVLLLSSERCEQVIERIGIIAAARCFRPQPVATGSQGHSTRQKPEVDGKAPG